MKALIALMCMATLGLSAQPKRVTESVQLTGQTEVELEFAFADVIVFKTWDKNEVLVEVEVEIDGGEHNDIFTLNSSKSTSTVYIEMDEDMWKKIDRNRRNKSCSFQSNIYYTVFLPKEIKIEATTISGDYEFEYFGAPLKLKTISGAIDMTVPSRESLDFRASTISGEVFTDLEVEFPFGKEGLRQIVGQKVRGRISKGGPESEFETISGDIYLRKG